MTTHTGSTPDPDGYALLLNGLGVGPIGVEDTILLRNLPQAEYSVGLAGIAANCDSGGGNPRGIRVEGLRTTRVIFQVKCSPAGPGLGPTS